MNLTGPKIKRLPDGEHGDGRGLYLRLTSGTGSWRYRYQMSGRRRVMGLGSYPEISLAAARRLRDEAASKKAQGIDPLEDRKVIRSMTVREAVEAAFEARKCDLKGDGEVGRWMSPMRTMILPKLGSREIAGLTQHDIVHTLQPVWRQKPNAAKKALQRLGIAVRHAKAGGVDVDAGILENAKIMLGSQGHTREHIPSMPYRDVPAFFASLGNSSGDRALKLLILTASRSKPVRFAHSDQIENDIWTIPGELMKGARGKTSDFRIPLPRQASELVSGDGLLFPGRGGVAMSDMTLTAILKRRGLPFRPHGFRASFRTWADETGVDWSVSEASLAHVVGSSASRAYRRSDMIDRRRLVMQNWADHLTGCDGQIIPIRGLAGEG